MLNRRYVLKTLRGGERGRFSQRKHNNLSTLCTTALYVMVVRPNKMTEQSTSELNTKYKSKQALFHFGFRAQQNPLIKKVIRVT